MGSVNSSCRMRTELSLTFCSLPRGRFQLPYCSFNLFHVGINTLDLPLAWNDGVVDNVVSEMRTQLSVSIQP